MADTFLTGFGQGPVQAGTQLNDLHEVVEVSGLERGVLTIVDEGEQFAGLLGQGTFRNRVEGADHGSGDQGGGRGSSFLAERRQLGEVLGATFGLVTDPAMQTEVEGPGDEGRLQYAPPFDPVHIDGDRAGKTVTPILPDLVLVVLVRLDPRVGQATLPQDLLQGPGPGLVV